MTTFDRIPHSPIFEERVVTAIYCSGDRGIVRWAFCPKGNEAPSVSVQHRSVEGDAGVYRIDCTIKSPGFPLFVLGEVDGSPDGPSGRVC